MAENATLLGLIRLQRLDDDVWRIRRRLEEGPRLVERRSEKFHLGEVRVREAEDRLRHAKSAVAQLELELKSREQDVQKASQQQLQARTNQEYKALGDYMTKLRAECSRLEDQILEGMGGVEAGEQLLKDLREQLQELRAEKEAFEGQWQRDAVEYAEELGRIQKRREELVRSLAQGPLSVYERVLKAREGEAVVPVEGRVCSACRMAITPNDIARLKGGGEIVSCKSCERILFLPEVHGAAL